MGATVRSALAAIAAVLALVQGISAEEAEFQIASVATDGAMADAVASDQWAGSAPVCDHCALPLWVAGVETVFMRPYFSEDFLTSPDTDIGFKTGYRFWLGREFDDGLGARIRFFDYKGAEGVGFDRRAAEFTTLDAEMTQEACLSTWAFLMSGGVRYAETKGVVGPLNSAFSGTGLTLGVEGTRPLRRFENLHFVIGGRWSGVFGNSRDYFNDALINVDRDDLISIFEAYMGPQFRWETSGGSLLTLGGNVETQNWNNGFASDTQDVGLFGFTLNAQYMW